MNCLVPAARPPFVEALQSIKPAHIFIIFFINYFIIFSSESVKAFTKALQALTQFFTEPVKFLLSLESFYAACKDRPKFLY